MNCRTNCCKKFSFLFALLAMAILAAPAFAQNCLQDEFTAGGGGKAVCTANDVSIAAVKNVQVIGGVGNKCLAGQPFSFIADFEILTTSKSSRSNVGLYFGTGTGANQNGALSGTCTDSIIAPQHPCSPGSNVTCGTAQYAELDGNAAVDNCGDTSSTDSSPAFGAGTEDVVIEVDNVTCPLTGTSLSLPECTSWQVPGKQLTCFSPSPSFPYVATAIPGSPSKCSCGTLSIPVQPIQPTVTVAKSCNTTLSTGAGLTSCDAGPEGSTVTYHVAITNTTPAGQGGVVVDQICDNRYGNVFTAVGFSGAACPAGTVGTVASTTCPPGDIANGATGTCDFTAAQGENASVTDKVTVKGHSDLVSTVLFGPTDSNTVTVTSSDAPSTAAVTKGVVSTTAACATVRYSVDVKNTSGADENLTLPSITDSAYGSITTVHGSVQGTTCGVAVGSPGLGSLSGVTASATNGGALPASLPVAGADYQCHFDAEFCGNTGPVEEFGTGTCNTQTGFCSAGLPSTTACTTNAQCDLTCPLGITHTNTVSSGTITGDETAPPLDVVTETDHQLIVNECLASFTKSN
jgi:hypothetical protein